MEEGEKTHTELVWTARQGQSRLLQLGGGGVQRSGMEQMGHTVVPS